MGKRFNVDGLCYPDEHYMVNIDNRLEQIQTLIDDGKYFVMNRARQYGKTTTRKDSLLYIRSFPSALKGWGVPHTRTNGRSAAKYTDCSMM